MKSLIIAVFLSFAIESQAQNSHFCQSPEGVSPEVVLNEFGLGEAWNSWSALDQFYNSQPMTSESSVLKQSRQSLDEYQKKWSERLSVAKLTVKATQELPEMIAFLQIYQQDMAEGELIINSQEIPDIQGDWAQERQEITQLFYEELETKYRPHLMKALNSLESLSDIEKTLLAQDFFTYYGKDLELDWNESFQAIFRHMFDTVYLADLFPKYGRFSGHSYGVQADVTLYEPQFTSIIAYRGKLHGQDKAINFSLHLYPFSNQPPTVSVCDFTEVGLHSHCESKNLMTWCQDQLN